MLVSHLVDVYAANICVDTRPYPGMQEVIDHLNAENITWGVVTNKKRFLAMPILEALDLLGHCKVVVGGDCAARIKPHPDPILMALNEIQLAAESVVYVGDHQKDVTAGQSAGTQTIAVSWGYTIEGEDPTRWGADYTIEHPGDLLKL